FTPLHPPLSPLTVWLWNCRLTGRARPRRAAKRLGDSAMPRRCAALLGILFLVAVLPAADDLPQMKFNDVKEIAPGVFFRYSSIGPEGSKIPFGGSNNIWVVFEDYVVVIDANFPKEAGDV